MNSNGADPTSTQKRVRLPEPDSENITVLTHELPNEPILPWHHYDSPWLPPEDGAETGEDAESDESKPVELDAELEMAEPAIAEPDTAEAETVEAEAGAALEPAPSDSQVPDTLEGTIAPASDESDRPVETPIAPAPELVTAETAVETDSSQEATIADSLVPTHETPTPIAELSGNLESENIEIDVPTSGSPETSHVDEQN